jgi:anti-sigma B factor antagonist
MGTRDLSAAGPGLPVRRVDRYAAAALPDEIDLVNALEIRDRLCAVTDSCAPGLIVDMSATSFCDSTVLAVLLRAYRQAQARRMWLRLVVRHPHVRNVVRLVTLDGLIPVHTSVAEAVAAARHGAAGNEAAAQPPRPGRVPGCAARRIEGRRSIEGRRGAMTGKPRRRHGCEPVKSAPSHPPPASAVADTLSRSLRSVQPCRGVRRRVRCGLRSGPGL